MRVLLVDGFVGPDQAIVRLAGDHLDDAGHQVTELRLVDRGFDRFMSAAERAAYHDAENLVTPETKESADLVRTHDALLVCTPLIAGTISPYTKGWVERVFVPGVAFTFTESGRITGAIRNLRRVGMIVESPDGDREPHRRQGSGRSVLRGLRLNAARTCRTTYAPVGPGDDAAATIAGALARW